MTAREIELVRGTFSVIDERSEPLMLLFYGRLFQIAPSVRPMFRGDIGLQGRKFAEMLAVMIAGLDDFEQQRPALRTMGLRHAAYGVVPEHYDILATALLWALDH